MTQKDLDLQLSMLNWSRAKLCRKLGLHRNTPGGWTQKVPKYVDEYLRVCLLARQMI